MSSEEKESIIQWTAAYPDINIVGYGKAGTSHLYRLLTGHSQIEPAIQGSKEFCLSTIRSLEEGGVCGRSIKFSSEDDLVTRLHDYYHLLFSRRLTLNSTAFTVNGCIGGSGQVEINFRYVPPQNSKFIVMLRDPAEWLWASWNFWSNPIYDSAGVTEGQWSNPKLHYRTPDYFHEIIASLGKLTAFNELFSRLKMVTFDGLRMIELVGRSNVLFLRSEDIEPESIISSGTLERLARFLSLDGARFGNETNERTNCNDDKGELKVCSTNTISGLYTIAGKRRIMMKTIRLIHAFCRTACITWYDNFNTDYHECRNFNSIPI